MIVLLLAACAPADSSPTWSADVAPLFGTSCDGCHSSGGIAPFTLDDYETAYAQRAAIRASVESRSMPPWLAGEGCNTYQGDPSLTDDQVQTILDWVDAGAPLGDTTTAAPVEVPAATTLSRVDETIGLPEPYTPQESPDDYHCFVVDWPVDHDTYVTGFQVDPDNKAVVHHVIAYLADPASVASFRALDDAEAGPGYTCFGGPGGSSTSTGWLGAWAPGGVGGDFPAGTGIPVEAGSAIVLQVHYNTANVDTLADAVDQSSLSFETADTVDRPARVMPWTDPTWVAGDGMTIPAHTDDVTHTVSITVPDDRTFVVHSTALHMHTLGRSGTVTIGHPDGTSDCLVDIPAWDFDWQRSYRFTDEVLVNAGDTLNLSCTWDNPTDTDIAWGEGTGDEMCLSVFYATEP